jgi:hypothetical protein
LQNIACVFYCEDIAGPQGQSFSQQQFFVGPPGESFGRSVAVSGGSIVIGGYLPTPYTDPAPPGVGKLYVYRFDHDTSKWVSDAMIERTDTGPDWELGYDVAIDADVIAAGFFRATTPGRGVLSAGVFRRSASAGDWRFESDVTATADTDLLLATRWLSLSGDRLAIGDPYSLHRDSFGSVQLFAYSAGQGSWAHFADLYSAIPQTSASRFGWSVSIDGATAIVGAPELLGEDTTDGKVHFFELNGVDCNVNGVCDASDIKVGTSTDANHNAILDECENLTGDVNHDGVTNIDDLVAVIIVWGPCPQPLASCSADVNGTGTVDIDDLVLVITRWSQQ